MALTRSEFEALMDDGSKTVRGDLAWEQDEDHSPSWEFRAEVQSTQGYPLFVRGSFNPLAQSLSYVLILKTVGRVYGLCLGKDHHNPKCDRTGEKHKHRWTEAYRDKEAYVPNEITAPAINPVEAWRQFCQEARIVHEGRLAEPPPTQGEFGT
jgi:hypothetical protein